MNSTIEIPSLQGVTIFQKTNFKAEHLLHEIS